MCALVVPVAGAVAGARCGSSAAEPVRKRTTATAPGSARREVGQPSVCARVVVWRLRSGTCVRSGVWGWWTDGEQERPSPQAVCPAQGDKVLRVQVVEGGGASTQVEGVAPTVVGGIRGHREGEAWDERSPSRPRGRPDAHRPPPPDEARGAEPVGEVVAGGRLRSGARGAGQGRATVPEARRATESLRSAAGGV